MKALIERLQADGCLAIIFVIFTAAAYLETYSFSAAAAMWPRWVLIAFGVLSLMVVARRLLFPEKKQ